MKATLAHFIAGLGSFLALIAIAPPELQSQIPQVFPEHCRGGIALGLGLASFLAKSYLAKP